MLVLSAMELISGMKLSQDIHFYDSPLQKMVELKKNSILSMSIISRLKASNVDRIVVDGLPVNMQRVQTVDEQIKKEAISGIQRLAVSLSNPNNEADAKREIKSLMDTTETLINGISTEDEIMVSIADLKDYDDYTYHHSLSVAIMALAVGTDLKLLPNDLKELVLSGLLHDIGKTMIPIEIINKPSKLTPEEFQIIKMHPVYAANSLIKQHLVSQKVIDSVISHHEKWDGTGYPSGLSGDNIPLFGRILSVTDVYDALTSIRPYRTPSHPSEALEYIMGGAGTAFDLDVVRAFIKHIAPYPVGEKVKLSSNQTAIVLRNYPEQPLRPIVNIVGTSVIYDLYKDPTKLNIVIMQAI
ncbi:MAG: HD-GYP domain-containing protein [Oscillospiraceae bacterium]